MHKTPTKLSSYRLERFALGELDADEQNEIENALRASNRSPEQVKAEIEASNAEILAQYPPQMMAARIQAELQKAPRKSPAKPRYFAAALTATTLTAALVAVLVLPTDIPTEHQPGVSVTDQPANYPTVAPEPGIRYKGTGPVLQVWRQTETGAERLENNAEVSAGDRLQVRFQAAGAPHGVIVSIDGRQQTTLHFPDFEGGDTSLAPGASTLNHSYQLDDAPDFERFFFITSDSPLDTSAILDALEELARQSDADTAPLTLSEDLLWTDFLVEKQ